MRRRVMPPKPMLSGVSAKAMASGPQAVLISSRRCAISSSAWSQEICCQIGSPRVPVFFIHGTADATVPVEQSIKNYEACAAEKDIFLTEGTKGYVLTNPTDPGSWNEERDYYYPIPTDELSLNTNLEQNPNW